MRFSNTGSSFSTAEAYATSKSWTLTTGAGTKTVYVQFKDAAGNWSASFTDTIVLDTTALRFPRSLRRTSPGPPATVTWTTSDPATSQVEYGRDHVMRIADADRQHIGDVTPVTVSGFASRTTYDFRVRSKDAAANETLGINGTFKTVATTDTQAPTAPTSFTGAGVSPARINLSWTASTDNVGVMGYKVSRNGVQAADIATTTFADAGLNPNTA